MAVLESAEYGHRRRMLAGSDTVRQMAAGLAGVPREECAHDDGTPLFEFMMAANREYDARRRPGDPEPGHIGAVAEAVLMVLDARE